MNTTTILPGFERRCVVVGVLWGIMAICPAVLAVWTVPGFVTQDGPAHVYNAHILFESLRLGKNSPFADTFEANWRPLPNLGGHLMLMGMLAVLPAGGADRAMTTLSLAGFAGSLVWLRWRVRGRSGLEFAGLLAGVLAMNMPWLMGFSNFLIGASLALLTWGLWWGWRDRLGLGRGLAIGALLVVGYLGHLVSLGLTVVGLVVLAMAAPGGRADRLSRLGRTLAACSPIVPLALLYKAITSEGGAFEPIWEQSGPFFSPIVWAKRLSWIDPIALGRRDLVPLLPGQSGPWGLACSTSLWLGLGMVVLLWATVRNRTAGETDCRAWALLAAVLLLEAFVGPDGFGEDHGYFLTQRVALLGLACLVPALDLNPKRRSVRIGAGLVAVALAFQSAFVWDYAIESDRRAGPILQAGTEVGRGQRIGTLLIDIRGRFRANPLLHADCRLGVGTGNVIWSNYETRHYYFPVQVREGVEAPPSAVFEEVALRDDLADSGARATLWEELLRDHGQAIDVILCWGDDPTLETITARWARSGPTFQSGPVRISRRPRNSGDARQAVPLRQRIDRSG